MRKKKKNSEKELNQIIIRSISFNDDITSKWVRHCAIAIVTGKTNYINFLFKPIKCIV